MMITYRNLKCFREKDGFITIEYSVSIIGGYDDERDISRNITNMLLTEMQKHDAKFTLNLAITGKTNTEMKGTSPWPRIYGGGVNVSTGEVFTAMFDKENEEASTSDDEE